MRVSYQLLKVVMRSIKTSLGGWSGDVQFISLGIGIPYLFIIQLPLFSLKPPLSLSLLAVSNVNNIGCPLLCPKHREVALIAHLTACFKYD